MRIPYLLSLLPLLVAADSQAPLKDKAAGWFDKAKSYVSSAVPSAIPVPEIPHPIDAGAAKVAENVVEKINVRNWQRKLSPKLDAEEEWMIYLTGGNKSCYGRCGPVNTVWNESVPLLAALSASPGSRRLKLGLLDCEKDEVLCTAWASGVPVIYHFMVPKAAAAAADASSGPSTADAPTPLHIVPLNLTSTEVSDIVSIPSASKSRYLDYEEYTGLLHPIDGLMAKFGLLQPFGYFMWALGSVPGWVMMLGISFVSRQIMSRRMAGSGGIPEAAPQAQAAPAPRVAPATGSQPRGGAGGSAKKRK
ncbi:hypothetical protein G647_03703 [Cladophialophora carrionii CBS 160.54]|uniref:Thioredoxin domain-containing protein n=1 Tax=Cladophialophora carrionii CBS 160.54 TaxID=1279043 RepID=V9DBP1_9EURO|nr:uncharacterized protein G647_03703 [Cladophialophora carrionii CBS 160.54]ETI24334.1 hypothetical protein G647_03703 [Cladophialophora carrionii CBS 160.54]